MIYELHVRGFTAHPSSSVPAERRGTFAGLIDKIPYLLELGVTVVELMPVFQVDPGEGNSGATTRSGLRSPQRVRAPRQRVRSAQRVPGDGAAIPYCRARGRARRRLVRVIREGTEEVRVADLRTGDLVLVRPGAGIPADGVVREGMSEVNESMITGESRPVGKGPGAKVVSGTVNGSGSLRAEVTGTGEKTALAGIMRLVEQAQSSRSRAQTLADRAAFALTIIAVAAAAVTLVGWFAAGAEPSFVIERVVTVLVIACPTHSVSPSHPPSAFGRFPVTGWRRSSVAGRS